jgi:hypothetical protein
MTPYSSCQIHWIWMTSHGESTKLNCSTQIHHGHGHQSRSLRSSYKRSLLSQTCSDCQIQTNNVSLYDWHYIGVVSTKTVCHDLTGVTVDRMITCSYDTREAYGSSLEMTPFRPQTKNDQWPSAVSMGWQYAYTSLTPTSTINHLYEKSSTLHYNTDQFCLSQLNPHPNMRPSIHWFILSLFHPYHGWI